VNQLLSGLPEKLREEIAGLFAEMEARESDEAKLFKALDNMEALVSHNEAPISTWLPMEYEMNLVYGQENAAWSSWTKELRSNLKKDTQEKIQQAKMGNK